MRGTACLGMAVGLGKLLGTPAVAQSQTTETSFVFGGDVVLHSRLWRRAHAARFLSPSPRDTDCATWRSPSDLPRFGVPVEIAPVVARSETTTTTSRAAVPRIGSGYEEVPM